MSLLM